MLDMIIVDVETGQSTTGGPINLPWSVPSNYTPSPQSIECNTTHVTAWIQLLPPSFGQGTPTFIFSIDMVSLNGTLLYKYPALDNFMATGSSVGDVYSTFWYNGLGGLIAINNDTMLSFETPKPFRPLSAWVRDKDTVILLLYTVPKNFENSTWGYGILDVSSNSTTVIKTSLTSTNLSNDGQFYISKDRSRVSGLFTESNMVGYAPLYLWDFNFTTFLPTMTMLPANLTKGRTLGNIIGYQNGQ